jgi:hypothetical protein
MRKYALVAFCIFLCAHPQRLVGADNEWILEKSTLTYQVSHPLHRTEGVSHAAKGKAICHEGTCNFLIAVPVKSFDSGDSNRDVHMVQAVRGGEFPLVTVRLTTPENAASGSSVNADLRIEFAGQAAQYKVPFDVTLQGNEAHVSGTIPATMSDFKITPPSLLGIACRNEMPVKVDLTWRRQARSSSSDR